MRGFIIFLIVVAGLGFLYLRQKQNETASAPSKYNFMKRDLDRARDVVDQSRARTREAQNPAP
jgi:hypothetical protein